MNILTGYTRDIVCKNGTKGMILNFISDEFKDDGRNLGFNVDKCFINQNEFDSGVLELQGKLCIGGQLRIFKEPIDGMDKVTMISCTPSNYEILSNKVHESDKK